MVKGVILKTDFTMEEMSDISLEALQGAVGGYVTLVRGIVRDSNHVVDVWCADDAYGMPVNLGAIFLFNRHLIGDVAITGMADEEGNTRPIPAPVLKHLYSFYKPKAVR